MKFTKFKDWAWWAVFTPSIYLVIAHSLIWVGVAVTDWCLKDDDPDFEDYEIY